MHEPRYHLKPSYMKPVTPLLALLAACWFGCKSKENLNPQLPPPSPVETSQQAGNFYFPKSYIPGQVIKIEKGKSVFYVEKSGEYYRMEGDILFTQEQVRLMLQAAPNARAVTGDVIKLWPGGVVPYTINANVTTTGDTSISRAIQHWESKTAIRFVPRTNQADYIEFTGSNSNNSFIGRKGGAQTVNFVQNSSCTLIHELGHAIGFFHEQSRADRNSFISINWNNIRPEMQFNFQTYVEQGENGLDIGTFDFESIMLYPSIITDGNFVYNTGIRTISRLTGPPEYWPNICALSQGDIESANALYRPVYLKAVYGIDDRSSEWEDDYTSYLSVNVFSDAAGTIPLNLPRRLQVKYSISTYEHPSIYGGYNSVITLEPGQQSYFITSGVSGCRYDGSMNPVPGCRWTSLGLLGGPSYTIVP